MGSGPNGCFTPRTYQHVNLTTIMIATFALFVILSATNGWVVTHAHAWIYLAIYAAFVVYVILDAIPGIVPGPASR